MTASKNKDEKCPKNRYWALVARRSPVAAAVGQGVDEIDDSIMRHLSTVYQKELQNEERGVRFYADSEQEAKECWWAVIYKVSGTENYDENVHWAALKVARCLGWARGKP